MKRLENRIARLETANRRYLVLLLLLGFVFVARVGMAGADESVPAEFRGHNTNLYPQTVRGGSFSATSPALLRPLLRSTGAA